MRHIIPISGKDSLATALVQLAKDESLGYEYVYNPTGAELPVVHDWIHSIEDKLDIKINIVSKPLEPIIESYGYWLPSPRKRYCTIESKIKPFVKWIGKKPTTVYYGIRADEERTGFDNSKYPNITPNYPLIDINFGLTDVLKLLNRHGLKPPTFFWPNLYKEVSKNFAIDLKETLPEFLFDTIFAWRSRANCYFCFNQRVYELVGLLQNEPEYFDKMQWYESQGTSKKNYHWRSGYPCSKIRENEDYYFQKHVKKTTKTIQRILDQEKQLVLFETDETDTNFYDVLSIKSCGLFCGK